MITDTKLACVLWAAVLAVAGCAPALAPSPSFDEASDGGSGGLGAGLSELRRAQVSAALAEEGARTPPALDVVRGTPGPIGIEFGQFWIRPEKYGKYFNAATYYGIRYSRELGLNWGFSLTAGYYGAEPSDPASGVEKLEVFPLRLTLEMGTYLGATLSRLYLGGGGGYFITDGWESSVPGSPGVASEWTAHAVLGFEFRNETSLSTRIEGGHTWLLDSTVDVWSATGTLAYQF